MAWCIGNAEARGFYRAAYDAALLARLFPAVGELRPAERVALLSDSLGAGARRRGPISGFLDLVASLRDETDHVVLDEIVGRLSLIEHRHLADADREQLRTRSSPTCSASAAAKLGWGTGGDGEDDETRLRRAVLLRALVLLARDPAGVAEAALRAAAPHAAPPTLDPNLLDVVVTAAARSADEARFEDCARRARTETDPAAKRRFLHALARVETPALVQRAVELALTDDVPMQDFTSYVGVLLGNRATREAACRLIRDRWTETRAKADSPMILRRLVEALGALPERRHLAEVEAFLAAHPIDGAKQATAQTLERMQMDADLRDRLLAPVGDWLRARAGARRNPQGGIARAGGLLIAAIVAAATFGIGLQLLPKTPLPPAPPLALDAGAAPHADAAVGIGDAAADHSDAASEDAAEAGEDRATGGDASRPARVAAADAAVIEPGKEVAVDKPGAPEQPTDKDIAREAWRHNAPDIRVDDVHASLLVPLKGSSTGASFHITNRPHAVIIKLPKAAALITMKLYRLKRHGFRQLWIYQNEVDAKPEDGTVLKVIATDPDPPRGRDPRRLRARDHPPPLRRPGTADRRLNLADVLEDARENVARLFHVSAEEDFHAGKRLRRATLRVLIRNRRVDQVLTNERLGHL